MYARIFRAKKKDTKFGNTPVAKLTRRIYISGALILATGWSIYYYYNPITVTDEDREEHRLKTEYDTKYNDLLQHLEPVFRERTRQKVIEQELEKVAAKSKEKY